MKGRKLSRSDQLWRELDEVLGLEDSNRPGIFKLISELGFVSLGWSWAKLFRSVTGSGRDLLCRYNYTYL